MGSFFGSWWRLFLVSDDKTESSAWSWSTDLLVESPSIRTKHQTWFKISIKHKFWWLWKHLWQYWLLSLSSEKETMNYSWIICQNVKLNQNRTCPSAISKTHIPQNCKNGNSLFKISFYFENNSLKIIAIWPFFPFAYHSVLLWANQLIIDVQWPHCK